MTSSRPSQGSDSTVEAELAARRGEFTRLLQIAQDRLDKQPVGTFGHAPAKASFDRLARVVEDPWPHPDDVLAALLRLRASLDDPTATTAEDAAGEVVAQLGEGAYQCAAAHGALDVVERVLTGFGTAYSYLNYAPDEVRVRAADGTVSRPEWVPAREFALTADGVALYGALRDQGHSAARAAELASLAFASPAAG